MKRRLSALLALCMLCLPVSAPAEEELLLPEAEETLELVLEEDEPVLEEDEQEARADEPAAIESQATVALPAEVHFSEGVASITAVTTLANAEFYWQRAPYRDGTEPAEIDWQDLSATGDTLELVESQDAGYVYRCIAVAGEEVAISGYCIAVSEQPAGTPTPEPTQTPEPTPEGSEEEPEATPTPDAEATATPTPAADPAEAESVLTYVATSETECTITGYTGTDTDLTIPETLDGYTVTAIGAYAFEASPITSVTFPATLTAIGEGAFGFCEALTAVTIPASVAKVGNYAFGCAIGLERVTFEGASPIGMGMFSRCSALSSVDLGAVTALGDHAFVSCTSLTQLTFPDTLKTIGEYALSNTGLTSVTIPDSVTKLSDYSFMCCNALKTARVGSGIRDLADGTFDCCLSLETVELPDTLERIGVEAFICDESLKSITLPSHLKRIGMFAFYGCTSLTRIDIPAGVTEIEQSTFSACTSLRTVTVAGSLTEIGEKAFFFGASTAYVPELTSSLETVTVAGSVGSIGSECFTGCVALKTLRIGSGATKLDYHALYGCTSLSELTIPGGISSLSQAAFRGCRALKSVVLNRDCTEIPSYTFRDCSGLTELTLPKGLTSIGYASFQNCTRLTSIELDGLTQLDQMAFYACSGLTSVSLTNGPTTIPLGAFYKCTSLKELTLTGVGSINDSAFYGCSSLAKLVIPAGTTTIGLNCFAKCTGLKIVVLPSSLTSIGTAAFPAAPTLYCSKGSTAASWGSANGNPLVLDAVPLEGADFGFEEGEELPIHLGDIVTPPYDVKPLPANAYYQSLIWSSADPGIAEVQPFTGAITAKAPGTTAVTATMKDGDSSFSRSLTVSVYTVAVESVRFPFEEGACYLMTPGSTGTTALPTALPEDSDITSVTLVSSDDRIVRVEEATGTLVAGECGTATVTMTVGDDYGHSWQRSFRLTVRTDAVKAARQLTLTGPTVIGVGETITPTVTGSLLLGDAYRLKSSSSTVVSVNDFTIRGLKKGSVTVTAVADSGASGKLKLTVKAAPDTVTLDRSAVSLAAGDAYALTATLTKNSAGAIGWSSSDPSIASVSDTGRVTAVKAGTAEITATTYNGRTATCTVTVLPALEAIVPSATDITLGKGETYTVTGTLQPCGNGVSTALKWSSSNAAIAKVSSAGVITAVKPGSAVITVTGYNGTAASVNVTVTAAPSKVTLITPRTALAPGEQLTVTAAVNAGSAGRISFLSSNAKVATVSADGIVTARAIGTATITAKAYNGKKATFKLSVFALPTSIAIDRSALRICAGDSYRFTATLPKKTASAICWESSDTGCCTVDADGRLTAVSAGEAVITATTLNGRTASCTVRVITAPPQLTVAGTGLIANEDGSYTLGLRRGRKLALSIGATGTDTLQHTLSSSATAIATVSGSTVAAVRRGSCDVTVTAFDGTTAVIHLTVT